MNSIERTVEDIHLSRFRGVSLLTRTEMLRLLIERNPDCVDLLQLPSSRAPSPEAAICAELAECDHDMVLGILLGVAEALGLSATRGGGQLTMTSPYIEVLSLETPAITPPAGGSHMPEVDEWCSYGFSQQLGRPTYYQHSSEFDPTRRMYAIGGGLLTGPCQVRSTDGTYSTVEYLDGYPRCASVTRETAAEDVLREAAVVAAECGHERVVEGFAFGTHYCCGCDAKLRRTPDLRLTIVSRVADSK